MTGLGDRLRRALTEPERPTLRDGDNLPCNVTDAPALSDAIGGGEVQTPVGTCWVIDIEVPADSCHGAMRLGDAFGPNWGPLAGLSSNETVHGTGPEETLYLDLETTGLDHGAGTQVFLAGLAWREHDRVRLRQILLREPSEEAALLHVLNETIGKRAPLITFNGASFDLTLLRTRCAFHRRRLGEAQDLKCRPHLDLLHLCRSLFRGALPNTRLSTLEQERLDFCREGDVPGHLVPEQWHRFVSTRDPAHIAGVLEHNVHDVLSMIALTALLGAEIERSTSGEAAPRFTVNLGRLLLRRGRSAEAYRLLQSWRRGKRRAPLDLERDGLRLLAIAARRQGDVELQRATLERLVRISHRELQAMIDLAILEEHRARDLPRALAWAEAAHALEGDQETSRRLLRLRRRLSKAGHGRVCTSVGRPSRPVPTSSHSRLFGVLDAMDRSP